MENVIDLSLHPLDTLFCRDGRPFGAATRASGGLPNPQTVAGALRTRLLAAHGLDLAEFARRTRRRPGDPVGILRELGAPEWVLAARCRGPWLGIDLGESVEPLLPVPLTLVRHARKTGPGDWAAALPCQGVPGWTSPTAAPGQLALWRRQLPDARPPGGYLTVAGVNEFLNGKVPADEHWFRPDELYGFDARTGIGVNWDTLTAADSQIYMVNLLALRPEVKVTADGEKRRKYHGRPVCLCCSVVTDGGARRQAEDWLSGPLPLGGEGKYAEVRPARLARWVEPATSARSLHLLATPGLYGDDRGQDAWLPAGVPADRWRGAAVGPPAAVSGWDVARGGPRPTRFAVPAGSVYFIEGEESPAGDPFAGDQEGWGYALRGTWNYGRE